MEIIKFQDIEFMIREVELSDIGNVLISTNSLNEMLLNEEGRYFSDEAISIDNNIFYFVDDNQIELTDNELINLIAKEIK